MVKHILLGDLKLRIKPRYLLGLILAAALVPGPVCSEDISDSSFLPVWQLLNREQKQQFVAGYLHAMKDAAKMTEVLSGFVNENPASAGDSMQRLKGIFLNLGEVKADDVSHEIDTFYSNPKNKEAPLSRAITGARNKM